jgi:hypothetical protein
VLNFVRDPADDVGVRGSRTGKSCAWALIPALVAQMVVSDVARASGDSSKSGGTSNSSTGSSGSDSSKGSNDSSNSSEGSSENSRGTSKDSGDSTENSPQKTSDYTTKGSSDWTTNSRGAHVFSIALAVVAVGATVVGVVAAKGSNHQPRQVATAALAGFMRRQHAMLTHDVTMAEGPVFEAWAHDLRLTGRERAQVRRVLDGSPEQGALLEALNGPIDERRAERFAAAFLRVTTRAIGPARSRALVARAAQATGVG